LIVRLPRTGINRNVRIVWLAAIKPPSNYQMVDQNAAVAVKPQKWLR
jgi:hypothetical protein